MLGVQLPLARYLDICALVLRQLDHEPVERLAADVYAACEAGRFVFLCGGRAAPQGKAGAGTSVGDAAGPVRVTNLSSLLVGGDADEHDGEPPARDTDPFESVALPGDLLIVADAAGASRPVLAVVDWANRRGLVTWALTGGRGGKLHRLARSGIRVPLSDPEVAGVVHTLLLSWVLDDLYARLHHAGRYGSGSEGRQSAG